MATTSTLATTSSTTSKQRADELMRQEQYNDALELYQKAWNELESYNDGGQKRNHHDTITTTSSNEIEKVWLLLSTSYAAIQIKNVKASQDALGKAFRTLLYTGIVVGNPFFHLLVGLTHYLSSSKSSQSQQGQQSQEQHDNFARAVICGGPAIFGPNDQEVLQQTLQAMGNPPAVNHDETTTTTTTTSWEGYEGVSRDCLNGAADSFLGSLIEARLGKPMPYQCEFDDDEDDDDIDDDDSIYDDDNDSIFDSSQSFEYGEEQQEQQQKHERVVKADSCFPPPAKRVKAE